MKKGILLLSLLLPILSGCNKFSVFEDYFVAFDPTKSGSTLVSQNATLSAEYSIHLSSAKISKPIKVYYEIIVGNGLTKGKDFVLGNENGYIEFYPGIFDQTISIKWLKNSIDTNKDCTLELVLTKSDNNLILGYPGPDARNKSITIIKY